MPNFEENLERMEKVVEKLETGDMPLHEALSLFEEGINLSNSCRQELDAAEGKVEMLLKQNGKMVTETLDVVPDQGEFNNHK